ncbi:MAG: hypothetical protein Q4C55_00970 [Eubacterium sp.]|nr:hypothetical protein [Eubacterium sp.]
MITMALLANLSAKSENFKEGLEQPPKKKKPQSPLQQGFTAFLNMAPPAGIEPATNP